MWANLNVIMYSAGSASQNRCVNYVYCCACSVCVCVHACVRVCVRACVCACVCVVHQWVTVLVVCVVEHHMLAMIVLCECV